MSFLSEAIAYSATLQRGSSKKAILDYLTANARGRSAAKTWDEISRHLASIKKSISKNSFQQGLLKESRAGNFFIASNDRSPSPGYYIIITKADAKLMRDWYDQRIKKERSNLNKLKRLSAWYGMPI